MQLVSIKTIIAVLWLVTAVAVSLAGKPHSLSSWIILTAVAFVPPLAMMWFWNDPRQTMSESIHEARR